ncbi:MAG: type 4a pilus biogenesis protein PilO [Candidatus Omnitrophica bacterium]|nr:type 4a pilus biogenesis protein PilO [Candidatus Omnitrophota bacterium]
MKIQDIIKRITDASSEDKKKMLMFVLFGFFLVYVDVQYFVKPRLKVLRESAEEISRLDGEVGQLKLDLARLRDLKSRESDVRRKASSMAMNFIREDEIVSLLQNISDIAGRYQIKINQIKPSKEAYDPGSEEAHAYLPGQPLLITMYLRCDYHNLGRFVNDLEHGEVYIMVQNIKITPQKPDSSKQQVHMVVKTYVEL